MQKSYVLEREGQIEFFDNYGIPWDDEEHSVLVDNTDGVWNGVLFEFKLRINNLNRVLFQAIKYLSRMRIRGESVPATILLVSLNDTTAYVYKSEDYRDAIQTVYTGSASKDNEGFIGGQHDAKYDYSDMAQSAQLRHILKDAKPIADMYMPVKLDEDCIVGWAERYYRENPKATKGDFLGDDTGTQVRITGEIRNPKHFAGHILPYQGKTNEKFKYLMDCLNDRLSKKDLGAFYTPEAYCKKAAELVQMAVERVPDGNDYVIIDRCAGTGNLESALVGLYDKNGSELISHCIVSTYEYYEYKVLMERIGDKVREVIPPSEANVVYANGKVANADAMSKEYIENPIIRQYVDNPKCTIILFENPPYRDTSASEKSSSGTAKQSYMFGEMQKDLENVSNSNVSTARDLANQFIWSAWHYYMRQPEDGYVLFSPIKYWKSLGLSERRFEEGFLFNRAHFHATASAISCIFWSNHRETVDKITLNAFDLVNNSKIVFARSIVVHKARRTFEVIYDRRRFSMDTPDGIYCNGDGTEAINRKCDGTSFFNKNIIAFAHTNGFNLAPQNKYFTRLPLYDNRGTVIRTDVYLNMLPMFVAKMFPQDEWYEKDVYSTTSDGGDAYTHDLDFLKSCLIYTCLSNQNKCLTFDVTDQ